jgi:UDP-3-O-[3-hydroxymyristoyl] glucosamine N-acyltransferase
MEFASGSSLAGSNESTAQPGRSNDQGSIGLARSLGELAAQFGCEIIGDPTVTITEVATLYSAGDGQLSFFANRSYRDQLRQTRAAAVVIKAEDSQDCPVPALVAEDPYLVYALIATQLYPVPRLQAGVHASANIASNASVSPSAEISANVTIEGDAVVGDGVYLAPGVVVGPRCTVGNFSRILANVTLVQDVIIGERCIMHPGAVIGADGFGNARTKSGWVKVPQVGGVRIGNDVEIGANTNVDRGSIGDTVIEDGVRLDNLIQIGHNARVGAHTAMAALCGISGSTVIGQRCMLGGQVGLVGHINICDDVVIGGATMISKDITEPGFYTGNFPGEKDTEWKRKVARFRRLGDLIKRVATLEQKAEKDK